MTPRLHLLRFALTMRASLRALLFLRAELGTSVLAGLLGVAGAALVQLHLDALALPDARDIDMWSLSLVGNLGLLCAVALLLLAWVLGGVVAGAVPLLATAGAMALWPMAVRYVAVSVVGSNVVGSNVVGSSPADAGTFAASLGQWLPLACWLWWSLAVLVLAVRAFSPQPWRVLLAVAFVPLVCWPRYELGNMDLWWNEPPDADVAGTSEIDTETTYYQQDRLTAALLATVRPGTPGVVEMYFVGFAGDGNEDVFMNEVTYVRDLMRRRYGDGHALALINNAATVDELPLANRHNLERVLRGVGEKMNRDEDILFVYFSSHGSQEHQLSVFLDALNLDDLEPLDVEKAVRMSGATYRVVGISACYSGAFLPPLRGPTTLAFSAARADRTSFGCGNDRDFTYFGEALFRDQIAHGVELIAALDAARESVAARERRERLTPSEPQVIIGAGIGAQLRRLAAALPLAAATR